MTIWYLVLMIAAFALLLLGALAVCC